MSQYSLASAQTSNVSNWSCSMYVSNNLWCHFQQCPWGIGSVWAERVGQREVGWYIHRLKTTWLFMGLAIKIPQ